MTDLRERLADALRFGPMAQYMRGDWPEGAREAAAGAIAVDLLPLVADEVRKALLAEAEFCRKHAQTSANPGDYVKGYADGLLWVADCIEYRALPAEHDAMAKAAKS